MARIHDLFIVELAEVIKGYGNDPDAEDPFSLSKFYRFYELPNIAVSRENFEKMRPVEPEHKTGNWMFGFNNKYLEKYYYCSNCGMRKYGEHEPSDYFCSNCGADMRGGDSNE